MREMFPFDDVIMRRGESSHTNHSVIEYIQSGHYNYCCLEWDLAQKISVYNINMHNAQL